MNSFFQMLQQGTPVQQMLDAAAVALDQPLILTNADASVLLASHTDPSASGVNAPQSMNPSCQNTPERGPSLPLRYEGKDLGILFFPRLQSLSSLPKDLVDEIQSALSLCICLHGWKARSGQTPGNLSNLFRNGYLSKVECKAMLAPSGLYDIASYRLFFLMPGNCAFPLRDAFFQCFSGINLLHLTCSDENIAAVLADGRPPFLPSSKLYSRLLSFARDNQLHVFVSGRFPEILSAKNKLRHCEFLMKCVTEVSSPLILMDRFNMFDLLLASGLSSASLRSFCSETLLAIRAHDDQYGTDYLRTLRTYLVYNRNLKEAGAALFVHPNTVLYRIHAMERRFCFDLSDTVTVFSFTVSLYIMLFLGIHDPI